MNDYCNQKIVWKKKDTTNKYNKSSYLADKTIDARFEYKRKLVRAKNGESVISEARLFTETAVRPDDIIVYDDIDWLVISVQNNIGLDGSIEGFEVNL